MYAAILVSSLPSSVWSAWASMECRLMPRPMIIAASLALRSIITAGLGALQWLRPETDH